MKVILISLLFIFVYSQIGGNIEPLPNQPSIPIPNNITTNNSTNQTINSNIPIPLQSLPFNDGDIVLIESTAIGRAFLWSKIEGCNDKKPKDTCGDLKAFFGINEGTRYIIRKSPAGNAFCLSVAAMPNLFVYLKDVKDYKAGDNDCGSGTNIVASQCESEFSFNFVPVRDNTDISGVANLYALQSMINSGVYLKAKVQDCAGQIDTNDKPHECGNVNGKFVDNLDMLQRGRYIVFRIYPSSSSSV
jgi:hypothetical protein